MHTASPRLAADCRGSTPGCGVRQWTSSAPDATLVNTGAAWSRSYAAQRDPLPSQPQLLSDIAHREGGARIDLANNRVRAWTNASLFFLPS